MTSNSNGQDTSGLGSLTTAVASFAASAGNLSSSSQGLTNGKAQVTYTGTVGGNCRCRCRCRRPDGTFQEIVDTWR